MAKTQEAEFHNQGLLIWNGYIYNREKIGKNSSWWHCKRYTQKQKPKVCCGRVKVIKGIVEVTAEHSHGPEAGSLLNHIPDLTPQQNRANSDMQAAVKGFVCLSDQQLLQSRRRSVVKRHKCNMCDMKFAISRVMETHKILEHQVPVQWKCGKCGMQFLHGIGFNLHMARSHLVKPHWCDFPNCSATFDTKSELILHKRHHQQELKDTELECEKEEKFKKFPVFKMDSKQKEKPSYKCPYCAADYKQPSRLKYHMRTHTGEKPYKCNLCSKTFMTSSKRSLHLKLEHSQFRSHLCDWCGKKFKDKGILNSHVRVHTGEKPYSCSFCSRAFSASSAMRVHMRQHTGEKPYVCDQCGQSFTVKVSLRTHLKSKHGIVVNTGIFKQPAEPEDNTIPKIGRPSKNERKKQSSKIVQQEQTSLAGHFGVNTAKSNIAAASVLSHNGATVLKSHSATDLSYPAPVHAVPMSELLVCSVLKVDQNNKDSLS